MDKTGICYFYNNKDFGGPDINLLNYVRYLDRTRFSPSVVLARYPPELSPIWEEYARLGVDVSVISHRRPSWRNRPLRNVLMLTELPHVVKVFCKVIRVKQAEIVHTNTIGDLQTMLAARLSHRPLVATIREIYTRPRWICALLSRLVYRLAHRIVVVSDAVAQVMFPWDSHEQRKVVVIHNGVDPSQFQPGRSRRQAVLDEFSLSKSVRIVGMVGLLDPWKGPQVLLEAATRIAPIYPNVIFMVVGAESTQARLLGFREQLILRASEAGLSDRLILTGYRANIPAFLEAFDVFVHCTVVPDPFPTTVIEAMAMGKPIVASAAGGVLEQVQNGVHGLLVRPGDAEAIAKSICVLLNDPSLATSLGANARKRAIQMFSWEVSIQRLMKVYDELLEG